jgi:hypothetical protein
MNRSATDQIFCIHQVLEKNGSIMEQHTNFKKAYDWVRTEYGIPKKPVTVVKMCLNKTQSKVYR